MVSEENIEKKSTQSSLQENDNTDRDVVDAITEEPKATHVIIPDQQDGSDDASSVTVSEVGSGYQDDMNECNEFCLEFFTCFGLFSTCCPATGEGCLTSFATFCGTFIVGCIKC